jgi:hypothetical protein
MEAHVAAALWIGVALLAAPRAHAGEGSATEPSDPYGHLALGTGMSVQYDGTSTTPLALATWTWDEDRYELAAIRFLRAQTRIDETLAGPNWTFEFSQRWRLNWSLIELNGSRLNFAEQLGWRFLRQENGGQVPARAWGLTRGRMRS